MLQCSYLIVSRSFADCDIDALDLGDTKDLANMDYEPEAISPFFASGKEALSLEALSTLRVMAFLDPEHFDEDLFEPQRQLFEIKNEELEFDFPTTEGDHAEACAELVEASLIQRTEDNEAYCMSSETQKSVLADTHTAGLIAPLFNASVKVLTELWPAMICVPDRTLDPEEYATATAPGTDYEKYLKNRHITGQPPPLQEYVQYARSDVWGQRDEFVSHIARLEHIFYHLTKGLVEVCATITFAQLLTEAAWCVLS